MSGNLSLLLEDLSRLVRTESPSTDLDAVGRSARVVADLVHERLGRRPEILCVDGVDHVLLRGADPKVMLLGHHDTVWPLGTLDELPYTETAGVVSGPGCFDMKLGLVQAIHALAWLRRCRGTGVLDQVTLLITGDEELGSTTSRALIEQEAGRCRAALVLEAAGPGGALKTGRKGVSLYRIEVLGRAAHSGLDPEKGVNATIAIAEVVLAIAQLADPAAGTTVTPTVMSSARRPTPCPRRPLWLSTSGPAPPRSSTAWTGRSARSRRFSSRRRSGCGAESTGRPWNGARRRRCSARHNESHAASAILRWRR